MVLPTVVSSVGPAYVGVRPVGGGGLGNGLCSGCHLQGKDCVGTILQVTELTVNTSVLHWPWVAAAVSGAVRTNRS